ncbi:hypothetical protein [Nonomuraea insulae]|uniref:Major facilitator superfamily (MFS) profile domain-containing protein n=1 Tax=Nonomuraea insulae TaxID=1616787 RepID=A0ABW1CZ36_9ACTN
MGGPLAGGAVTDAWEWRWIFYVNLLSACSAWRSPRTRCGCRGAVGTAGSTSRGPR